MLKTTMTPTLKASISRLKYQTMIAAMKTHRMARNFPWVMRYVLHVS